MKILNDESLPGEFIDKKTKGYYKHFIKYIEDIDI